MLDLLQGVLMGILNVVAAAVMGGVIFVLMVHGAASVVDAAREHPFKFFVLAFFLAPGVGALAQHFPIQLTSGVVGFIALLFIHRRLAPWLSDWWRNCLSVFQRESQERTDISKLNRMDRISFDPAAKWDSEAGICLGLRSDGNAYFLPHKLWRERHMQVVGPTGTGKGVLLQALTAQVIGSGDGLVIIDPKRDGFLPHVVAEACAAAGRRLHVLDLKEGTLGGWHPFCAGSAVQRVSRAVEAFDLSLSGSDADVYKIEGKALLTRAFTETDGRADSVSAWIQEHADDKEGKRERAAFALWGSRSSLCPSGDGFDSWSALDAGDVIYVRGDPQDSELVVPIRSFLYEVAQWRVDHPSTENGQHLTIVVDEVSLIANLYLAQVMATIREPGANLVLAYQSLSDLETACVNPGMGQALRRRVDQNAQIKVFYGTQDNLTAGEIAKMSGTRQVWKQFKDMAFSGLSVEVYQDERKLVADEEEVVPENLIRRMGEGVAVVFQPAELARLIFTAPVQTDRQTCLEDKQFYVGQLAERDQEKKLVAPTNEAVVLPANARRKRQRKVVEI